MKPEPMEITLPNIMDIKASGIKVGEIRLTSNLNIASVTFTQKVNLLALLPALDEYAGTQRKSVSGLYLNPDSDEMLLYMDHVTQTKPRTLADRPQA